MGYSLKIAIDVFKDELTILYSSNGTSSRNDGNSVDDLRVDSIGTGEEDGRDCAGGKEISVGVDCLVVRG